MALLQRRNPGDKKLNILLAHSGRWEYPTGIIIGIRGLAEALADNGHSVKVVLLGESKSCVQDSIEYVFSPNLLHFIWDVHRQCKGVDVIHCDDTLAVLASLSKKNHALIYTNHSVFADPQFHYSYHEWRSASMALGPRQRAECITAKILGQNVLKRADKVLAVSNFVKETVSQIYKVPDSKIEVVFKGINTRDFIHKEIPSEQTGGEKILFLKPNEPRKGLHHLLKALPLVLKEKPELKVIAAGPEPSADYGRHIQNLIDEYQVSDRVIFTGKVDFAALVSLYLSSDVVTIPSLYEAFATVALEAGMCGKPVVASNTGGLTESVVDQETGFLVNVKSPSFFAEAVIKLLSDESLRERLGENGRKRVLGNFTWDKIALKIESIYRAALK